MEHNKLQTETTKKQTMKELYEKQLDEDTVKDSLGEERVYEENIRLAGKVHTINDILNMDFTLAVTDKKLEDWINKQIIYTHRLYELMKEKSELWAQKTKNVLVQETLNKLVFTKSRNGRVLKAFLTGGEETADSDRKLGILQKLFTSNNNPQQEVNQ